MFGRRPDGYRLDNLDPIVQFTPYIMKKRHESINLISENIDYEPLAQYIRKRSMEGTKISFMALMIAAYVRAVAENPALNRFVANKQIYARKSIQVSIIVLRKASGANEMTEANAKMTFQPSATIDEVAKELYQKITEASDGNADNSTASFASKLIHHRILIRIVVAIALLLDRYGLLPKYIYDLSPFHCSMYLTNMASIRMPAIYHHLYNIGNTTCFLAMGKCQRELVETHEGVSTKLVLPLCISVDERVCGGASFAKGMISFKRYLNHPELMEVPPLHVRTDEIYMKK